MSDFDIVIAGGGHNALACAAQLLQSGLKVCVIERNDQVGGGTATREVTLPGFRHDMFGSSHLWLHLNPDFQKLQPELEKYGLKYIWSDGAIQGHPNLIAGDGIVIHRDLDRTCDSVAAYSRADAKRYRDICDEFVEIEAGVVKGMFAPPSPPSYMYQALEKSPRGLSRLRDYQLSVRRFTLENFENEHVRTAILGWSLAPQITPDQLGTANGIFVMLPSIHRFGQAIPEGGSQMLAIAMRRYLEAKGATVMTNATVEKFLAEGGDCIGLRLSDGTEITARHGVVSALDPVQTYLKGFDESELPDGFAAMVKNYSFSNVTMVRVHYALHEPPRYKNGAAMDATPFQRIFSSVEGIDRHYQEIGQGLPPSEPSVWAACWTKMDPTRAPAGKHTLAMDTFVPIDLAGGKNWDEIGADYVREKLLGQLRRYTTNMGDDNILAHHVQTGPSFARDNLCFYRGSTNGGERTQAQMGAFRPFPNYSNYRGPLGRLYMTGASTHPGAGISAMGTNTAREILRDIGAKAGGKSSDDDDFEF